ncbi:undecaprenyldiphospho-muramoylpentapeptide beta-N-acetylglucosaminyltransferase [Thiospirillum jenense]|uniref:UDP-N-acetylglucosamine--N-acetylmuramyl-(pentapeptide) pyrophosphoryl-undecaprenol N-acetylglucosamine transferase n=1 Tax=Thiospirillum jenense TaxID=1653858 RepID=A0A839HAT0_9GAMM|nr:undecaprenyldiphospho-muramoylpentapeptide beta-N-acetylglucosaminyltransferase [Thiospirillum jenense]MBB1126163.1 undecaprenyldiphospho-muramoylpentapeptide beta-N-acetylglucosaminyltransferase [Thiospirillum jenense]
MGARIAIMAGGTGGHVFPALAVAEQLRQLGLEPFWIGTRAGLEARLVPAHGLEIEWLTIEGLRGKGVKTVLRAPLRLTQALHEAAQILNRRDPAVVLGMGGFVAGPGGVVARLQGRPLVIHEQNRIPGLTNRWLAPWATQVFQAFADSFPAKRGAITVGNPVRASLTALLPPAGRWAERLATNAAVRLLVLGGSRGALALNTHIPRMLTELPELIRPQVWHQTGELTFDAARAAYAQAGVTARLVPFIDDMAEAYDWADVVICRAGALTISELAAVGLPAILIPFPHAVDDHQTSNAAVLTEVGAAYCVQERALAPQTLAARLAALLTDPCKRLEMATAARQLACPDAALRIAASCQALAN